MLDPFPLPRPPLLSGITHYAANHLGLEALPLHIHEILLSAIFYHIVCLYISPYLSTRLFPKTYPSLPWKTKLNWDVHVVSLVQSTMINVLALWVIYTDEIRAAMDWKARVWGYTGSSGLVQAFATGYFLWDLWVCAVHVDIFGVGLLAHAVSALGVYSLGFRPFVNFYAPIFILYELSSPFLNFHWFFDKLGMTGSTAQLVNGIFLIGSFFASRLVYGVYQSYCVFNDIFAAIEYQRTPAGAVWLKDSARKTAADLLASVSKEDVAQVWTFAQAGRTVPMWFAGVYLASNVVLTCLNIYWFGKMIETVRKRFPPPLGTKIEEKRVIMIDRNVDSDARKSVEVDAVEVKPKMARRRV